MRELKFSIIVPIYGVERYIKKCSYSLLGQTYNNIQYIFINDGTKDNSISILQEVIDNDFPDRREQIIIINRENRGLPATREEGVGYATGDFILHVDSDDWMELNAIESIAKHIEENPTTELVSFDFITEGKPLRNHLKNGKKILHYIKSVDEKESFIRGFFTRDSHAYVWNKCVKRAVYERAKIYFPKYNMHEDVFLMSQLVYYSNSFSYLPKSLYHYNRLNPAAITKEGKERQRRGSVLNMLDLYRLYCNMPGYGPLNSVVNRVLYNAAWSNIKYNLCIDKEYLDILKVIKRIPISKSNYMPLFKQIVVKIFYLFK